MSSQNETQEWTVTPEEWDRITESLLSLSSEVTESAAQEAIASEQPKRRVAAAGEHIG